jgi:hypothetical protein
VKVRNGEQSGANNPIALLNLFYLSGSGKLHRSKKETVKKMENTDAEKTHRIEQYRAVFEPLLKKGERPIIYGIVRHVARSGMSRSISFYYFGKTGEPLCLDSAIETILGHKRDRNHDGLKIAGCGMNMIFATVYNLGVALWGYGKGSRAESLGYVSGRNGDKCPENDGGYLLKDSQL